MAKKVVAVIKLALQMPAKPTPRRRWALPSVSTV